jgi:tetratricopeptide (TPR) repeat protein
MPVAIGSATAAPGPAPAPTWENEAWRKSSDLLVNDAIDSLPADASIRDAAQRRALDCTRAILLLNEQPKLQRNIDEARSLLESVRKTRGDDDPGVTALYYLARIQEFHADPPDPAKAIALYEQLIALAPGNPLAQAAVSRLAILRIYEDVAAPERQARLDAFEAAAGRLSLPAAQRDLHFVLAEALLNFTGDKEGALRHLLAAEQAGIVRQQLAGDTMVRIALLARQLGHRDIAIEHYNKFLSLYKRDARAYLLSEQLKDLEAETTPTPSVDAAAPAQDQAQPPPAPAASPQPSP